MISHLRRTKIIATFGPAITQKLWTFASLEDPANAEMVKKAYATTESCLLAGVNVARFNFSHGTHEEQLVRAKIIREVSAKLNRPISLMLDTKGPEIRVWKIGNEDGILYRAGSKITIYTTQKVVGDESGFSVVDSTETYNMAKDVAVNNTILVDDGKLSLEVASVDVAQGLIEVYVINDHVLKTNKRINLPGADYTIPFLSEKDRGDILFAIEHNYDYIAASFVNSKENLLDIKKILNENGGSHIKLIAKIETRQGIDRLDEILTVADGVMVARGDLGLEVPYYEVPYWGKYIIKKCRYANVPVIMATQMLDSLEKNIIPTRAESSDVFWAVELGVDATMLSGESAQGLFPINAINVMSKIDRQSEIFYDYDRSLRTYFSKSPKFHTPMYQFARKIAEIVMPEREIMNSGFSFQAIAVFGPTEEFITALSAARPATRVLVFTDNPRVYTGLGIFYGILPILVDDVTHAQTYAADYLKAYYDNQIQTRRDHSLSRKTLVVYGSELGLIDNHTPIAGVEVKLK
ncbi:pyruvate kinase [Mycoplasmoides fastidiosum]|uniref:Pyruvate kinase n=1 Tax=Mycoplasmoides fastidiosum TaxID=92758 RepID=A0ABU0LZD4_9BACT|nr:pyruvate kinase [Mycoplasmoides fastidiosum]MDQ0514034.1 pyruvate kinase [Mycoplasmoides fastidiosum]UUD37556.1 pyruvate kinase [Mycoplasmoides fastidiosum]